MINQVAKCIKDNQLFNDEKPLIVGVSGGVDSMVLLDILYKLKYKVIVAHINHNVRSISNMEAIFVKTQTEKYGYLFETITLPKISKLNFHNKARDLRYQFFIDLAKKYQVETIVTAHHADDLIETILMKFSRGSNLYGYAGINYKSFINHHCITHPLLNVNKETIIKFAKEFNILYMEDQSNIKDQYTRNRFRKYIIPKLLEENPNIHQSALNYLSILSISHDYIRSNTIALAEKWDNLIVVNEFMSLHLALQKDYLGYLFELNELNPTYNKINECLKMLINQKPNTKLSLGENHELVKAYNKAFFQKKVSDIFYEYIVNGEEMITLPNNDLIKITKNLANSEKYYLKLCYNNIAWPLIIRNRRNGDTVQFDYGKKKIKKILIDLKVPLNKRNLLPVVLDNQQNILGMVGITKSKTDTENGLYIVYQEGGKNA